LKVLMLILPIAAAAAAEPSKIDELRERALNGSAPFPTTRAALAEMKAMGRPGEAALREVARELLDRDAAAIKRAVAAAERIDTDSCRAAEQTLARLRPLALENIKKLDHDDPDSMAKAREYYQQLTAA